MSRKRTVVGAPNLRVVECTIEGTSPYVCARFSQKAIEQMREKMLNPTSRNSRRREPRDFDSDYEQAKHVSSAGWCGIPAASFRAAMISACRLVGLKMTVAKLALFVEADGFDRVDGQPLVRIEGEPERLELPVRNATGVADIRIRPMWREWRATVRVRYDADMLTEQAVINLLARAGAQVGIGEGRPDSRQSTGLGWGLFKVTKE